MLDLLPKRNFILIPFYPKAYLSKYKVTLLENRDYTLLVILIIVTAVAVSAVDAAGIPKKAISTVSRFLETDLPTTTVFTDTANTLAGANTFTGANTFSHNTNTFTASNTGLVVSNPAGSFTTTLAGGAVTANRTLNLPVTSGTDTLAALGLSQIWTGTNTFNALTLGGQMNLAGNTLQSSGHVYTFPSNTGTVLLTNGSGSSLTGIVTSITGTANNVTASASTGAVTLNLGQNVVVNNNANTYAAGKKQTFQADGTNAGVNFAGVSSDPSGVTAGDLWRNTGSDALKVRGNSATQTIPAFTGTCSNNQILSYSTGSSSWACITPPISLACSNSLASAAASYSCTSIGSYRYYKVIMNVTGLSAAGYIEMQFNGDTTSGHYTFFTLQYNSGTKTSVTSSGTYIGVDDPKTTVATERFITCDVWSHVGTAAYVQCRTSYGAANVADQVITDGYWSGTAQINEIDVKTSATTINAGSGITVWGMNSP